MDIINAIRKHRNHGRLAYIYQVRRELGLPRDVFDEKLQRAIVRMNVQVTGGDPTELTEDQIKDSYELCMFNASTLMLCIREV